MPLFAGNSGSTVSPGGGEGVRGERETLRLLRHSHIFASTVREILETQILREASPCALTCSQFQLLKLMSLDGDHQVGEVAGYLGVSPPAATKNIDKLERLGLVVRMPSKGDRRATLLSVSPKGRRLVRKYEKVKAARLSAALESFHLAELEQLCGLLERFSVSLLKLEKPGQECCLRCAAYIESDCPVSRVRGGCPYQRIRAAHHGNKAAEEVS